MSGFFVLCISWLVPLHFPPWASWHSEVIAFAAAALMLLPTLIQVQKRQRVLPAPQTLDLLFALGLVAALQAVTGMMMYPGDTLVLGLYLCLGIASAIRGHADGLKQASDTHHPLDACAWSLAAAALLSSAIALVQILDVWEQVGVIVRLPWARRAGGNLAQPNHLGSLLLLGVASMLYLRERKLLSNVTLLLGTCVLALAIASTESRTALLGTMALGIWSATGSVRHTLQTPRTVLLAVVALGCGFFLAWPALMGYLGYFASGSTLNTHPGLRLVVWSQLLEAALQKPWWGWGLRQVATAHNAVASDYIASEPFSYAHNLFIEMAVGMGLPLAILFSLAILRWAWRNIRASKSLPQWYCILILIILGIHSMLEFPYAYAYFLVPAFYAAGMLDSMREEVARTPLSNLWFMPLIAIALIIGAWSIPEYLAAEEDFRTARFEALRIGTTPIDYRPPEIYLFDQLKGLLVATRANPTPSMLRSEIDALHKAAMRYPWPITQHRYALALALNGDPTEALRQLQVIRAQHGERIYQQIVEKWRALEEEYPILHSLNYDLRATCTAWPCSDKRLHSRQ